ncbi:MAG: hypothetical protein ABI589_13695, partial [Burkholderiales bacterium]
MMDPIGQANETGREMIDQNEIGHLRSIETRQVDCLRQMRRGGRGDPFRIAHCGIAKTQDRKTRLAGCIPQAAPLSEGMDHARRQDHHDGWHRLAISVDDRSRRRTETPMRLAEQGNGQTRGERKLPAQRKKIRNPFHSQLPNSRSFCQHAKKPWKPKLP